MKEETITESVGDNKEEIIDITRAAYGFIHAGLVAGHKNKSCTYKETGISFTVSKSGTIYVTVSRQDVLTGTMAVTESFLGVGEMPKLVNWLEKEIEAIVNFTTPGEEATQQIN